MKLLLTILVLTAPLVLALRTRRASWDESSDGDLCSHPLHSYLCETSKRNTSVARRKTGLESPAASALNDGRPTLYASPSTITSRPTTTTTRTTSTTPGPTTTLDTTTQPPSYFSYAPRIIRMEPLTTPEPSFLRSVVPGPTPSLPPPALYLPPVTSNTSSPTPPTTQAPVNYSYRSRITSADLNTPEKNFQPISPQNPIKTPPERATPTNTETSTPYTTPRTIGSIVTTHSSNVFIDFQEMFYRVQKARPERPIPTNTEASGPYTVPPITHANLPRYENDYYYSGPNQSYGGIRNVFYPYPVQKTPPERPIPTNTEASGPYTIPQITHANVSPDERDYYYPKQDQVLGDIRNMVYPLSIQETPSQRPVPISTETSTPYTKIISNNGGSESSSPPWRRYPWTSSGLPPPPAYLPRPTLYTPWSPSSLPPRNLQPGTIPTSPGWTTGSATYRPPFHNACTPIFPTSETNPVRGGYVLCVFNTANYYDQVHDHQVHNHYYGQVHNHYYAATTSTSPRPPVDR